MTGARKKLPIEIKDDLKKIKYEKDKPVTVGFGISNSRQARELSGFADGIIVGSAVVKIIEHNLYEPDLVKKVSEFVSNLASAVHNT